MTKKLHKEIPIDYAVCQQQDCPRAGKCLHQIAYQPLIEQPATVLRLLYPGWGLPLLPRLRSRHLRTGLHRNTEPDVPGAIPAIHVDTHVPFRT
jgi:hypothetical protein